MVGTVSNMGGRELLLLLHQQVKPNNDSRSAREHYKQNVVFSPHLQQEMHSGRKNVDPVQGTYINSEGAVVESGVYKNVNRMQLMLWIAGKEH